MCYRTEGRGTVTLIPWFLSFALFANREYMGILMLPRTVTSKISWEKKTSQDGRCCKCFKGFAAVIYEFARLVFSKFISLGGTIEMFLKHLMEKKLRIKILIGKWL